MRKGSTSSVILIMLLIILPSHQHVFIQAQDESIADVNRKVNDSTNIQNHSLRMPQFVTLKPTLVNYGKGIYYYEHISMNYQDKTYNNSYHEQEKTLLMNESLSDMELDILQQNLHFMNKQSQDQLMKWIKKDKWDLNLGEAIKGFYMKPPEF